MGAGFLKASLQGKRNRAVVAEGTERGRRHGVDCVRPDEAIHVEGVRVEWILGAGASPQRTLDTGALRCQTFPAFAAENFAETGISHFGVGDGDLAL